MMTETTRRTAMKRAAAAKARPKHQPAGREILDLYLAGDFFQPSSSLLDLDSFHAQVEQFLHGDGATAIGHGDDDAMDFLYAIDLHQVGGHRVAGNRAFHFARPTDDLDADFGILAQSLHQLLRAFTGAQDVDALDQNRELDQPGKTKAPSEESNGEGKQANRRRTAPRQNLRPYVGYTRQNECQHPKKHKQAEIEFPFGMEARRVIQVKPV